jgi:hypothetical protein
MPEKLNLLPCPFCGGPGVLSRDEVECKQCGAFGPDAGDIGESVALWNTRHDERLDPKDTTTIIGGKAFQ